jgi:hypothetical protein
VELNRAGIERQDFRLGRWGYEPAAVASHLRMVADEIEEFRRISEARKRVRARAQLYGIAQAAMRVGSAVERSALQEAKAIREEAAREAIQTRAQAGERARGQVETVSEAASIALAKVEAMEGELGSIMGSLKTTAGHVYSGVDQFEGALPELVAVAPRQPFEPDPIREPPVAAAPAPAPATAPDPTADQDPDPATEQADTFDRARVAALGMAIEGRSYEETSHYLRQNYPLPDRLRLLDDVYALAERESTFLPRSRPKPRARLSASLRSLLHRTPAAVSAGRPSR